MRALSAVYRRELASYLATPTAYVFIAVFLFAAGAFTFEIGDFFGQGRADLGPFFAAQPWLLMVFLPALSMRAWAEERRAGTDELLLTLPAPTWSLTLGKFLAAWTLATLAIALTAPLWITVNVLGHPDNGAIAAAYVATVLMAGAYVAIGTALSAVTGAQVVAFVLAVLVGFLFTALGAPSTLSFARTLGPNLADILGAISILGHYETAQRGVLDLRALIFFVSLIAFFLYATAVAVEAKRGG
ncbi:MAG: ABC transporter permease subunit [Alphaproteobacteria bacterium]|nr:ABC transporter permease subunit [Alphaproteobacteria bacterium]